MAVSGTRAELLLNWISRSITNRPSARTNLTCAQQSPINEAYLDAVMLAVFSGRYFGGGWDDG